MLYIGVIALFIVGIVLVLLFVSWQYYLEWRLENPDLPRTRWTAPPLMKLSMWIRAHGRFTVMQTIACVNWAAFISVHIIAFISYVNCRCDCSLHRWHRPCPAVRCLAVLFGVEA